MRSRRERENSVCESEFEATCASRMASGVTFSRSSERLGHDLGDFGMANEFGACTAGRKEVAQGATSRGGVISACNMAD